LELKTYLFLNILDAIINMDKLEKLISENNV